MAQSICFNGDIFQENEAILTIRNRSFKYGDGVFETIKVYKGQILLDNLHFSRLQSSLTLLMMNRGNLPGNDEISQNILRVCKLNDCERMARVRLAVYRNEKNAADYLIEAGPLAPENNRLNPEGLSLEIADGIVKCADSFSHLKTASYLPYILAGLMAKEKNVSDCVVLNAELHVCETSKANIFAIKDSQVFTPPIDQGCIAGVMRKFLVAELRRLQIPLSEMPMQINDLRKADEVFLTNAVYGMRWVEKFQDARFGCRQTAEIYNKVFSTIYS